MSEGSSTEALHTVKARAFGSYLLRIDPGFEDGKVRRVAAEVVCHCVPSCLTRSRTQERMPRSR